MSKTKSIVVEGVNYSSLTDAARAHGLDARLISRRLKSGWSTQQAFGFDSPPKRPATGAKSIATSKGEFKSIRDAADYFQIPVANIQARLKLGWTPDEACEIVPHRRPRERSYRNVSCEGKDFKSVQALAEHYALKYRQVYKRLLLGWTPEQAVDLEPPPPKYRNPDGSAREHSWTKPHINERGQMFADSASGNYYLYMVENTINDKKYIGITTTSLSDRFYAHKAAAKKTTGTSKLYNAMNVLGDENFSIRLLRDDAKSIDELLLQEVDAIKEYGTLNRGYNTSHGGSLGTTKPISIDSHSFESYGQAAEFYGVASSKFNLRINRLGWSPEEAAELQQRGRRQRKTIRVILDEQQLEFPSIQAAAKHFGIERSTVHYRLKHGWTVEEALGIVQPRPELRQIGAFNLTFEGEVFKTVSSLAQHAGVSEGSMRHYLRTSDLTVEEIVFILKNHLQKEMQAVAVSSKCSTKEALNIIKARHGTSVGRKE